MMADGRCHALVLAAGAGRRFGGRKLLADWRGEPLIRAAVRVALAAPVRDVTVVIGDDAEAMADALVALDQPRLRCVFARDWSDGLSASLKAGLASLPDTAEAAVVFLGDMPCVPSDLAGRVLAQMIDPIVAAEVVTPNGPGHPVAFGRSCFGWMQGLSGDRGARSALKRAGAGIAQVVCVDPGATYDVDCRADLRRGGPTSAL